MIVTSGRTYLLDILTQIEANENIDIGLYTNDIAWTPATTYGDLVEAAWGGYTRQDIAAWLASTLDGMDRAVSVADPATVTFSNSTGAAVEATGWFAMGQFSGTFIGGDAFPSPVAIDAGGSRDFSPSRLLTTLT